MIKKLKLKISNMSCENCAVTIANYLQREKGVGEVKIGYAENSGYLSFNAGETSVEKILKNRIFTRYPVKVEEIK